MIRRTNREIKEMLKAEYGAMREAGCNSRVIAKALDNRFSQRLLIEAIQEYNDEIHAKA